MTALCTPLPLSSLRQNSRLTSREEKHLAGNNDLREAARIALANLDTFFAEGDAEDLDYVDRAREELRAALR